MTGNILQRAVPKKMLTSILQSAVPKKLFKSAADMAAGLPTDLQFRYLPGKKLLVLDLTGIEQAQWEEIAQQLDVGKETKPSDDSIGITYADLRGMKAGQIVQQITIDNGQETPTPYGTKFYADFMTIAGKTADINGNTFKNAKGKVVPLKNNNLKDYNGKIFTDGSGSKVYVHDSTAFQVFSYEQFLDAARVDMGDKASLKDDANFDRASRTWKQKDGNPVTGSITYRITDPVEKI
jgi:hypothetical protein